MSLMGLSLKVAAQTNLGQTVEFESSRQVHVLSQTRVAHLCQLSGTQRAMPVPEIFIL